MRLNELADNPGARKSKVRVGRGIGSGKGKTSARGVKGQKSRSGVAIKGFEGGQMPIHRRLPKRGFNNIFSKNYNEVNVGRIQEAIAAKKIDPKQVINLDALISSGIIKKAKDGYRVLGKGEIKDKVTIEANGASKGAISAIEKVGGSVSIISK